MRVTIPLRMVSRTYIDAVNALNSLQSNYANIMAIRQSGQPKNEMSLPEMREWTRRIGYTTSDFNRLNVIHITGTKGKGSTAAFTASILDQYKDKLPKIGLYTSPHLKTVTERIRINGKPISQEKFTKYFFEVWDKLESTVSPLDQFPHMTPGSKPGYFKYLTLLSFHTFLSEGCSTCVYEVGIGGEYDSTNIIEKPIVCGVTLLGIDHTFMLGNTIAEIAWNKGGIFKPNTPAFTVLHQPEDGLKVLQDRAIERSTTLYKVPEFDELLNIELGIKGKFQKSNASLAVALAQQALVTFGLVEEANLTRGSKLPEKFIVGLQNTKWDGRCQMVSRGFNTWFIDGAHTKDSIHAASTWFAETVEESQKKKILIFNQQTRDATALLDILFSICSKKLQFDEVIFTTNITWESGNYSADLVSMNTSKEEVDRLSVQHGLAEAWKELDPTSKVHTSSSIESAVNIVENREEKDYEIFVTGSLHLVGGLLVVFDN